MKKIIRIFLVTLSALLPLTTAFADCSDHAASEVNWSGCEKKGIYHVGLDLSGADFSHSNLAGSVLSWSKFDHAQMQSMDLRGANVHSGSFIQVEADNADFSGSIVANSLFDRAALNQSNFSESIVSGSLFRNSEMRLVNFEEANLYGVYIHDSDLRDANFNRALITNADFTGSDLSGAIWVDGQICSDGSIGQCLHSSMTGSSDQPVFVR